MKWACDTGKAFDESLVIGRQTQELSDLPNVVGYATLLDSRRLLWISTYSRRCDDVPEYPDARSNMVNHLAPAKAPWVASILDNGWAFFRKIRLMKKSKKLLNSYDNEESFLELTVRIHGRVVSRKCDYAES
ncbi:hypothetical protein T09_9491 [Trichinella sp. T9]|nr:hypothetical protein T09_9491 [Trichinella sp. T9]